MRAIITIEDTPDDMIAVGVIYEGTEKDPGFGMGSHAHQHVALVLKVLDQIAVRREVTSDVTPVTTEEVEKAFKRVAEIEDLRDSGLLMVDQPIPDEKIRTPSLTIVRR